LAAAGDTDEAQHILAPGLRTCAALGLSQLLVDEGPVMLRLAKKCVAQTDSILADDAITANVRDFALHLTEDLAL
jgi:serine/threonine-protein kinase/serine/threonine-protein kinase PknK